jgi:hypothetical protein
MEQKQKPGYIRKVKLKIELPVIKCSGRDDIECYYRGKVITEDDKQMLIEFKSHGEIITEIFNKESNRFENPQWFDLKIV